MEKGKSRIINSTVCVLALMLATAFYLGRADAADTGYSREQTVYVPIYSYIYYGNKSKTIDLTATLSIRNTDVAHSITIVSVNYYDSKGKLIKEHVADPIRLDPLATAHYLVAESDRSGGLGASFLVTWRSSEKVSSPVVEAVMIGAISAQGISFVCSGEVVRDSVQ